MSKDITSLKKQNLTWRIFAYTVMVFYTFLTVGPLFWLTYSAFKPHIDIVKTVFAFPKSFYVENFKQAYKLGNLGIYFINSVIYAGVATTITVFLALMCGYGFAKFEYKRLSNFFYYFFIMGLLITVHSLLIPLFVLELKLGIDDTRIGVIIPYIALGLPFMVYLAKTFVEGIPESMIEAGRIDGASYLNIFWHMIVPVSLPVVTTMLIFSFLGNWNEFVLVLTLTSDAAIRSLPVGINSFAGGRSRDFGMQMAALVMGTMPMIIFYIFFHKQIKAGFAAGSVKE